MDGQPADSIELHVCAACGSGMVYPLEWEARGRCYWWIKLRCPECLTVTEATYLQAAVERFDDVLDQGCAQLVRELGQMTAALMAEEADALAHALELDLIDAGDFAVR